MVCIQTTIGLPSNDYWFAPRPHIATQPPSAIFALHSPPSGPLPRSILSFFPREIARLPQENEIFFAPCNSLAYGEMSATLAGVWRNILREDLVCI